MNDNEGDLKMFSSRNECEREASNTIFGEAFGYEIFSVEESV
jgi:hypothetical protein